MRTSANVARKAFTVPEANAALPEVRSAIEELRQLRSRLIERNEKLQVLDALWGPRVLEASNPDHAEFLRHRTSILEALQQIESKVRQELTGRGIRFPTGGLEQGLVDFPTTWEGRWVYLCWQAGEPEVRAWHEVDGGYAGRKPLTDEQVRRMGREDEPGDVDDSVLDF